MSRILVIEDEESVRQNILELLTTECFDVTYAENGKTGLQRAKERIPDLILCDAMMPELDGYGVISNLRQNPDTAIVPFIFLTARTEQKDFRYGMNLGADDYLTKPFSRQDLLAAIRRRLSRHSSLVEKIDHLIRYDAVTDLPNGKSFEEILQKSMTESSQQDRRLALIHIGLDRFDRIHPAGPEAKDAALQQFAERLVTCCNDENLACARTGADQFAVIVSGIRQNSQVREIPKRIQGSLQQPFQIHGFDFYLTASIGVAFFPEDAQSSSRLSRKAEAALLMAQKQGGNTCQFYGPDVESESADCLILEADLYRALESKEFELYFQPQVSLRTGNIFGAEALVRWNHPRFGIVSPAKFISLAEENGLILPLSEWVLKTACAQAKNWNSSFGKSLRVAVNLSGKQFTQPDFASQLKRILLESNLGPGLLDLEITESLLIQNTLVAVETINQLKTIGIRISIDDFGVGYSSLSYLKKFPFDTLKIDKSFISNLFADKKDLVITESMIRLAHALDLEVIAEGVETDKELEFLRTHHCDGMQGYLFSRALNASEFESLISSGKKLHPGK